MFSDFNNKKIGNVNYLEIVSLQSDQVSPAAPKNTKSLSIAKSVDVKALSLYIKLLEMKMIYINNLKLILSSEVYHEGERTEDIEFLNRNILTIDKYLKNVLLKLRLRVDKDFR